VLDERPQHDHRTRRPVEAENSKMLCASIRACNTKISALRWLDATDLTFVNHKPRELRQTGAGFL